MEKSIKRLGRRLACAGLCLTIGLAAWIPASAEPGTPVPGMPAPGMPAPGTPVEYQTPPPAVSSVAVYMQDYATGQVVYAQNAEERRYPASLTKMVTALVCLEQLPDYEQRTVTAPAWIYDDFAGQVIGTADIEAGEQLPLRDVLYAALLPSACEAANLLAYAVDGEDTAAFVQKMNELAVRAGATATHFANAHGLFDENHYSTAHDIAMIARYALQNPVFYQIVGTAHYEMQATNVHAQPRTIETANEMVLPGSRYYRDNAYGVKTGTLDAAGRNLVSTQQSGDRRYLLVTMGAPLYADDGALLSYVDQNRLYDWAFGTLSVQPVLTAGETADTLPVEHGRDVQTVAVTPAASYTVLAEQPPAADRYRRTVQLPERVQAPLTAGQPVGTLTLTDAQTGQVVFTTDLLTQAGCEKAGFAWGWLLIPATPVLLVVAVFVWGKVESVRRRNRRRQTQKQRAEEPSEL